MIITGGTGAFLGVRGQAGHISMAPRVASVTEDPANRRANGGGTESIVLQLLPMFRPEIVMTSGVPAVVHASDFSLVTAARPAKADEILTAYVTGLGPSAGVEYGQPFPASAAKTANSPVEVSVNGTPAEVLFTGGYPGAVDGYQVNFRLPAGVATGAATLQLTAGFIAGGQVTIAVQ